MPRVVGYHERVFREPDMRKSILLPGCLLIAGCLSGPEVVQVGNNTYLINKQSRAASFGIEGLRADARADASAFCARYSSNAEILDESDSRSVIPGSASWVEVRFRCTPWRE